MPSDSGRGRLAVSAAAGDGTGFALSLAPAGVGGLGIRHQCHTTSGASRHGHGAALGPRRCTKAKVVWIRADAVGGRATQRGSPGGRGVAVARRRGHAGARGVSIGCEYCGAAMGRTLSRRRRRVWAWGFASSRAGPTTKARRLCSSSWLGPSALLFELARRMHIGLLPGALMRSGEPGHAAALDQAGLP